MKRERPVLLASLLGATCIALVVLGVLKGSESASELLITINPSTPASDVWIRFDASDESNHDYPPTIYMWDFGDGAQVEGATVYHRFPDAGDYRVALTATDDRGASRTTATYLTVVPSTRFNPVAMFTYLPQTPVANEIVNFQALAICRLECTVIEYTWDFGDGRTRLGAAQQYSFSDPGTYVVRLIMTDISGGVEEVTRDVVVLPPERATRLADQSSGEDEITQLLEDICETFDLVCPTVAVRNGCLRVLRSLRTRSTCSPPGSTSQDEAVPMIQGRMEQRTG